MRPCCSATGMKTSGAIQPCCASCQRASASTPRIQPAYRSPPAGDSGPSMSPRARAARSDSGSTAWRRAAPFCSTAVCELVLQQRGQARERERLLQRRRRCAVPRAVPMSCTEFMSARSREEARTIGARMPRPPSAASSSGPSMVGISRSMMRSAGGAGSSSSSASASRPLPASCTLGMRSSRHSATPMPRCTPLSSTISTESMVCSPLLEDMVSIRNPASTGPPA